MKKWIAIYVIGAMFTNSYIRAYRFDEWVETTNKNDTSIKENHKVPSNDVNAICTFFATVGWPVYVAISITDVIVSTKVKVEKPEILK